MPKMKSKRGLMKRIKVTKKGKVMRTQGYTSHLATHKSQKQKRKLRKTKEMHPSDVKRLKSLISN